MRTFFTNASKFLVTLFFLNSLSSCVHVEIKGAGVFDGVKSRNDRSYYVTVPEGIHEESIPSNRAGKKLFDPGDGSKIDFDHLGSCGAQLSFTGIMIPIIPFWLPNFCESDGFHIYTKFGLDALGVTLQLRYNSVTYEPYIDKGSVKFKIPDFSAFKKAPDKTLIIHKKKPDGTMWSKELPFEWKIVVEVSGGA